MVTEKPACEMGARQRVGWYMSEKKIKQLGWEAFVEFAKTSGVILEKLNLEGTPESNGKFDLIILKMTDELVRTDDPKVLAIVNNAKKIVELNPQAVVIDPLDNQQKTIDRIQMHELFLRLNALPEEFHIECPKSALIYTQSELDNLEDISYPLIVKQVQASGSLTAHDMGIVWKKEDLASGFALPMFVQEFVNHDATIFKIYVMSPDAHIITRKSLPNFEVTPRSPVFFNSQDWKHGPPEEHAREYAGKLPPPSQEVIDRISSEMSKIMGLTLFGYDIVTDINTKKHAIIDVNYFPDYKGVDDVFGRLLRHIRSALANK